ncbi:CmpA/NrtA family ABC transporter substrate-binding protein [Salinisphaera sp. Q1T1-3]|uniref:CmpA/NrtA family ABC transporter substrate-binding protein n=1 Tax=Salinisphaera sp. Q1T1-3 TaxID=2321229 RepID=UPI000E7673F2|nr:CmpA/NrtA family ABC transporter substrate-binding protein [Salinisphaera sp. Q1T1-3]RJS93153.1 nitrate ABC transporter substrate-binding protein [Salinisphaera sp. Q1T1-3]
MTTYAPPERTRLHLGFIALADSAPLVVAERDGLFAEEGLDVTLARRASWAAIRDDVVIGRLDGAAMLAGLPLAATLGLGSTPMPMTTSLALGANGNAICVGDALWQRMRAEGAGETNGPADASSLARVIAEDRAAGLAPLTFAMVHPVSSHHYQLRYWLEAAGIDPDRDVRLIVVPPARMLANLRAERIAGFCVGAPWSELAVAEGIGHIPMTGYELWNNAPEKVFGVAADWAEAYPNTHRAVLRALLRACHRLDADQGRSDLAPLMADPAVVDCPTEVLADVYAGRLQRHPGGPVEAAPDHLVFARRHVNFPWRSHGLWFARRMQRSAQLHAASDVVAAVDAVYRPDRYRRVCDDLGLVAPARDHKTEGTHAGPWQAADMGPGITLGADRFFDGGVFDPTAGPSVCSSRSESSEGVRP